MPHSKLHAELLHAFHGQRTRRHFLRDCTTGLGLAALTGLVGCTGTSKQNPLLSTAAPSSPARRARSVIYLHMAGAPSQLELFDYKPELDKLDGQECPPSLLAGKQFAFIEGVPKLLGPKANFRQRGQSGAWVSDYLPYLAEQADKIAFLKACHTDQFNHAPAQLLMHTGSANLGRPSMGSWITYGLGSENENLPGFVVLTSGWANPSGGKSLWGSGFLPTIHQGVQCRSKGDPVLFVKDPEGMPRDLRGRTIEAISRINRDFYEEVGDPEIVTRIQQYEMAFKMQVSIPEVMDISKEPDYIHELYGTQPGEVSFANNCLLARKLVENGVRYVQLFDVGWDAHGNALGASLGPEGLGQKCREVDRSVSALLVDLEQRGLLEETLVVWGGEFGRTPMQENREGLTNPFFGRDHHTDAFTVWMAGGGIKGGISHGETDPIGFYGIEGRTHVHDLQATILHQLGIDHEQLTFPFQGRDFRLTDVSGEVVKEVIA